MPSDRPFKMHTRSAIGHGCGRIVPLTDAGWLKYLSGSRLLCPACTEEIDLFEYINRSLGASLLNIGSVAACIGGGTANFQIKLEENKRKTFALENYGIPKQSEIVYINYTPNGTLFPLEMHPQEPLRAFSRDELTIIGHDFFKIDGDGTVSVMIVYFQPGMDHNLKNLISSISRYFDKIYEEMVFFAAVAVEDLMKTKINVELKNAETAVPDGRDGTTYLYFTTLLPLILKITGKRHLPEDVKSRIKRLNKLRNDVAHSGKLKAPISQHDASAMLAAAIVTYKYFTLYFPSEASPVPFSP